MRLCAHCGTDILHLRADAKYCGKLCRPPCSVDGCDKPQDSIGLCRTHAMRMRRHGDPLAITRLPPLSHGGACKIDGCDKPMVKGCGLGMCPMHYQRHRLYGDPLAPNRRTDLQDRSAKCRADGCDHMVGKYGNKGMCRLHARRAQRAARPAHYKATVNARRRRVRLQTPPWANIRKIEFFYKACPYGQEVDHIVPLKGLLVSGLHVHYNLQYLPVTDNRRKGNAHEHA